MVALYEVTSVSLHLQKSSPPSLLILVTGRAMSTGWRNLTLRPLESTISAYGLYDLELAGDPPTGISLPWITPVQVDFVVESDVDKIKGVIIHARTNKLTALIGASDGWGGSAADLMHYQWVGLDDSGTKIGTAATDGLTVVGAARAAHTLRKPIYSTLAIGEEAKTYAIGEEGSAPGVEKYPMQFGETPPLPWPVEIAAVGNKLPGTEWDGHNGGVTDPPPDLQQRLRSSAFGKY